MEHQLPVWIHQVLTLLMRLQVLSAYTQMATKARPDVEAAVGQLLDLANMDSNNVPVLMALAHGFLLLKQTAKARNQLKVKVEHPNSLSKCGCPLYWPLEVLQPHDSL